MLEKWSRIEAVGMALLDSSMQENLSPIALPAGIAAIVFQG